MILTIVIPENSNVSIPVPQNYIGKKMGVIIFSIDDAKVFASEKQIRQKVSFRAASLNTSDLKFDRDEANKREGFS